MAGSRHRSPPSQPLRRAGRRGDPAAIEGGDAMRNRQQAQVVQVHTQHGVRIAADRILIDADGPGRTSALQYPADLPPCRGRRQSNPARRGRADSAASSGRRGAMASSAVAAVTPSSRRVLAPPAMRGGQRGSSWLRREPQQRQHLVQLAGFDVGDPMPVPPGGSRRHRPRCHAPRRCRCCHVAGAAGAVRNAPAPHAAPAWHARRRAAPCAG